MTFPHTRRFPRCLATVFLVPHEPRRPGPPGPPLPLDSPDSHIRGGLGSGGIAHPAAVPDRPARPRRDQVEALEQFCDHCEYEITGLGPPGRLLRCPECGGDNRMGHANLDLVHPELPPWWKLALWLGWPSVPWAFFAFPAFQQGPSPYLTGMIILGGLVLFVALARAIMIAFDCSNPGRRAATLSWTLLWAVVGSVGTIAIGVGAIFSLWAIGMYIESVRPKQ